MFSTLSNFVKERVQAKLAEKNYTIVDFDRAAKSAAHEGLLNLVKATRDGTEIEKQFCEFALDHGGDSYSQYQQECFALWAFGGKHGGTFVEFGAADGITHSNSYMLERDYGWKGMLVEPLPWAFAQAKRRRPKAHVIEGAVDPTYAHESRTLEFISAGQLSTIGDYKDNDRHAATRAQRRRIRVRTINLQTEIAKQFPGRVIDFMSIDVEGPEVDIITGFDFDAIDVRTIAVEVNDRAGDGSRIAAFLEAKGFHQPFSRRVTRNDMWFTRSNSKTPGSR